MLEQGYGDVDDDIMLELQRQGWRIVEADPGYAERSNMTRIGHAERKVISDKFYDLFEGGYLELDEWEELNNQVPLMQTKQDFVQACKQYNIDTFDIRPPKEEPPAKKGVGHYLINQGWLVVIVAFVTAILWLVCLVFS